MFFLEGSIGRSKRHRSTVLFLPLILWRCLSFLHLLGLILFFIFSDIQQTLQVFNVPDSSPKGLYFWHSLIRRLVWEMFPKSCVTFVHMAHSNSFALVPLPYESRLQIVIVQGMRYRHSHWRSVIGGQLRKRCVFTWDAKLIAGRHWKGKIWVLHFDWINLRSF